MKTRPFHRPNLNKTTELKHKNVYTEALLTTYSQYALDEQSVEVHQGNWRNYFGSTDSNIPLDVEIGLGNGLHFAHHATTYPDRLLLGLELKYKPLIQSIRRAVNAGATNARALRYHAFNMDFAFAKNEINDVFVFFPDPWTSPRKPENRILNSRMVDLLYQLQRPGSSLYFKTDSEEAFDDCSLHLKQNPYQLEFETRDLHRSDRAESNFVTQFENLFIRKSLPIYYIHLKKPSP